MSEAETHAKLIESMIDETPWKDQPWARMALAIAARAIRRGRHLTEAEKLRNLADAMEADDIDPGVCGDLKPVIDHLRREAGKHGGPAGGPGQVGWMGGEYDR